MTAWLASIASRVGRRLALAGAAVLAVLAALAHAARRGAQEARDDIREETHDHIIERHEARDRVEDRIRRDGPGDARERLRRDGLGPRPRD